MAHPRGVTVHDLAPGEDVVVGRASPADIIVDDDALSRRHVRIAVVGGALMAEDLGSTNGTRVGTAAGTTPLLSGVPVTLESGARLWLGATQLVLLADSDADDGTGADEGIGLLPHGAFLAELRREVERARLFQRPLTLVHVRCDLDIAVVWSALARHRRSVDRAGVWARDHFELLWPETNSDDADRRARSLRERLGPGAVVVTASLPGDGTSADGLEAAVMAASQPRSGGPSAERNATTGDDVIIAASAAMKELLATVKRLARSRIPVILHGETGVGKEVIARALHGGASTSTRPFVAVNCGALPATLVESMLFGHEKGAFTGAVARQAGHFELAHGGTLFLDEIAELPLAAQTALLRVLETRQVRRLGGTKDVDVDVRVVAASHRDLTAAVAEGRFREDLLFRLNSFVLEIPPLRERPADVAPLAARFLAHTSTEMGRPLRLSDDALLALEAGRFAGNVRELRNVIERAAVLCDDDVIEVDHLPETFKARTRGGPMVPPAPNPAAIPPTPSTPSTSSLTVTTAATVTATATLEDAPTLPLGERLDHLERQILEAALQAADFDTAVAALALGLPRRTLQHRLKVLRVRADLP